MPDEDINPKFLRLLKTPKKKGAQEEDLFSQNIQASHTNQEASSLMLLSEENKEIQKWIQSKIADAEFKPIVHLFNLINKEINPDAPTARQLTLTVLKGTSFEDKRDTCLDFVDKIRLGEHTGQVLIVHQPYEDENQPERNDPYAMTAVGEGYLKEKFLGYIPKTQSTNQAFYNAIQKGRFCGAYLINAKRTFHKGEDIQIMTIVTGWIPSDD